MSSIALPKEGPRQMVGLLNSSRDLERALALFGSSGWLRSELSLLAQHNGLLPAHLTVKTASQAGDQEVARMAPVPGPDARRMRRLAAGGAGLLAAAIGAALVMASDGGAGFAVLAALVAGALAAAAVELSGRNAGFLSKRFLKDRAEHGGVLLWVRVRDPRQERKARNIFRRLRAAGVTWSEGGAA